MFAHQRIINYFTKQNMLKIKPAKWSDYNRFKSLCCVDTMPYHGGICWTVEGDIAFVGYNFCYRNNNQRNLIWPEHIGKRQHFDTIWLNKNIRNAARLMVRPEHRKKGIATQLLIQTLPLVNVPFIEAWKYAELATNILTRAGFEKFGSSHNESCQYFLWKNPNPLRAIDKNEPKTRGHP